MFETITYKGNTFTIWEMTDGFMVFVKDEACVLNSLADVREFIQYYNNEEE